MNKYLNQLVKLSEINKEIDAFEPRVQKIQKTLNVAFEKAKNAKTDIELLEEEIKDSKLKKMKNEALLAELSDKLKSISKKTASIKNEKEVKALQLEEDIAKEQCDFANEEIARLEKNIELKEGEKVKVKELYSELQKVAEEISVSVESERNDIKKEIAVAYAKKEELVSKMSQRILSFYEKIRKWAHNSAVVPVRKQACYGCFMRINDKTNALVVQSEDIITCPHCGRILYRETTEVA
ncbi:MAG: C4-type zinc ribbon domain-containing protein [Campylobacteraceae bacterium]|jgi:predicted  nucleic acid-binding Zn-ribbon protein|nr:C4-type zinc ribbon domain-containing protein [Campylobacteraceae bacterium]